MKEISEHPQTIGFMERILVCYYLIFGRHKTARRKRRKIAKVQFDNAISNAPSNAIAIDCGANIGAFTSLFLDKGFRVHAFEPDPIAAEILLRNVNNNPRLTFMPVAVGAGNSRARLFRSIGFEAAPESKTVSSSLLTRKDGDKNNYIEVDVINLLEYIENIPERIAVLKVDIEGAEVALLEELISTGIHRHIDFIFVETHERISFDVALRTARLRAKIRSQKLSNFNLDHN